MAIEWKMIVQWYDLKIDLKSVMEINIYALYTLFSAVVVRTCSCKAV